MSAKFVHLHNHTEYSLLDGANRIPDMVSRAKALGMESLAISDHGVMFGVMEFYWECKKQGVRPILGMEAYVAPNGHLKKSGREENETHHLLLLAKDVQGYRNLCKLATLAALEGYYYKPRVDHELLRQHSEGLIATTTCLSSEVCSALQEGDYDKAVRIAAMYREMFGAENYFVEIQDHGLPQQHAIREPLIKLARQLKLPMIATNDAHYLCKENHSTHDVLLCIQTGKLVADPGRMRFDTEEFYIKSEEEMRALFSDLPEAIENTAMVAEMCNVELGKQRANMPDPDLPEGETPTTYLRKLANELLPKRVHGADERALERLEYELGVIERTGYEAYFLLVREFANFARAQGINYGARGSAAGSLVSYVLGITDVDPLEYDLTFERFLNPERVSMPDIDMDFEDERRDEIIKYVTQKYGKDHVAQIITFGTLGAKAAIKDVGRALGVPPQDTDRICKTIPTVPGMTIKKALEIAEFKQMVEQEPAVRRIVEVARNVEGMARHSGVHAAGIVISREPIVEHIPLYRGNEGQAVTAFEQGVLEKLGLLKMDFLGLSNLTVLSRAIANIEKTQGIKLNIQEVPLDDAKTFEMLGRGETTGVFQLESGGMRRNIAELKPNNVRELAAMIALYRPGPIEHIPQYIDGKFGRVTPTYLDEKMRPILEETFGVIVYQDQVLKLVQALAGFSLGKADILRRAMGKKDKDAMASMEVEFTQGCLANGVSEQVAGQVWTLLEPFAGYAFNKAHAVCYAVLAYQTAYLKANFPVEYMAALLACFRTKEDKVVNFVEECRRQKIQVLRPDINRSELDFSIEGGTRVRFGLAAIKNVGDGLAEAILKERAENGPFQHFYEFATRAKPLGLNRTALESLVKAGAFEDVTANRKSLMDVLDGALSYADQSHRERLAGQNSLFGGDSSNSSSSIMYPDIPELAQIGRTELLALEKEVMGIYVSDHPLRGYERMITANSSHPCAMVEDIEDGTSVKLAGVIAGYRTTTSKKTGDKMAHLVLEDFTGQAGVIVFARTYERLKDRIVKDQVVKISGTVVHRERPGGERTVEVRLEEIEPLEATLDLQVANSESHAGTVVIRVYKGSREQFARLKSMLRRFPGSHEVRIDVMMQEKAVPFYVASTVEPSHEFQSEVRKTLARAEVEVLA